jgi:hypothetical protein
MTATELPTQASSRVVREGRIRSFLFEISPRCRVGQEITYGWEWGFPQLFDTTSGKEESSSFECLIPVNQLSIEIRFMHPGVGRRQQFAREPVLTTTELAAKREAREGLSFEAAPKEDLEFISYRWQFSKARRGDRFIVKWQNL